MNNLNIKARINRNKLIENAGQSYRGENSDVVRYVRGMNGDGLLGIQRSDGIYAIVGTHYIYHLKTNGEEKKISHEDFLEILRRNALSSGKTSEFEFLNLSGRDAIWLMNVHTMNGIWNTVLLLHPFLGDKKR